MVIRPVAVGALAEAAVDIVANLDTFEPDLRRKLDGVMNAVGKDVQKQFDRIGAKAGKSFSDAVGRTAAASSAFDDLGRSAERMERVTVNATKGMSDGFKMPISDVQKLEAAVQKASDSQADALGRVRVAEAQLADARKKSGKASSQAIAAEERLASAQRNAFRDSNRLLQATEALVSARERAFADAGEVAGEAAGGGFGDGFRRTARRGADDGGRDAGGFFARAFEAAAGRAVGGALLRVFGAGIASLLVSATPLSTVLGGATAAVVALAGALATASGSAISLGGVLGALGLAAATLKIGFSGVGDAMKEQSKAQEELARTGEISTATQERLDAAMKGLAPSARALVTQLGAMAPAWQAVTRSIQERLFTGVGTAIANLANRYLPILTQQLGTAATTINQTVRSLASFLNTGNRAGQISTIFAGLNGILRTLLQPLGVITAGFLDIFTASLPFAQQLATVLAQIGTEFGTWLGKVADGEGFQTFMQTAMTLAGNLFQLLGNIGSIIGTVFAAGTEAGGGLLVILRDVTGQFANFLKSAAGQQALASFFGLIAQAGGVLTGVFRTLQPLLSGIGALFEALDPALQAVGRALIPVVQALSSQLGATLSQLAPLLATLVTTGIGPLAAALGGILVTAVKGLTPIFAALVQGLTALAPGLTAVATVVSGVLASAFQVLGPLISQLLVTLGQLLGGFLQGFAPVLNVLARAFLQLLAPVVQFAQSILSVIQVLIPLLPSLGLLNAAVLQLVLAFLPLVTTILDLFADQAAKIAPIIAQAIPMIQAIIETLTALAIIILPIVQRFVTFGATLIRIFAAVDLAILGFVARAIGFFVNLAQQGVALAIRLGSGVVNAISSMVSGAIGFFSQLPARIGGFMQAVASTVKAGIDRVVAFFRGLPGQITGAISGLAGSLQTAGSNAIQGLINGLSSGLQRVRDIAGQIAGAITGPVSKILKIGSPSKLMEQYGAWTAEGLVIGIDKMIPTVVKIATKLAKSSSDAVRAQVSALTTSGSRSAAVIGQAMDALDNKIDAAGKRLADLVKQSGQLAQQVAQSIVQTGDITKSQDQSFAGIVASLKNAVTQAGSFNNVIARLKAAGLGETALQQIIAAGPETGSKIGQAILSAGKAGIQQINTLQTTLNRAATRAGQTAANSLYAAGISAARGLVDGLNRQRSALDAQMIRLGTVLARSLARVLGVKALPGLDIPGFARGTIARKPTLGWFGEAGPEAVIPLNNGPRAAELMDKSGLSQFALERALGNMSAGGHGKTREIHMPVTVAGLTKAETIQILKDFLVNTFGGTRIGLDLGDGVTL